jgi:hypothetical protein
MTIKWTEELEDQIAEMLAESKTLTEIGKETGVSRASVLRHRLQSKDFDAKCARARSVNAHVLVDDIREVCARVESGEISPEQGRVVINSKQWLAKVQNRREYGDHAQIEHSGEVQLSIADQIKQAHQKRLERQPIDYVADDADE